MDERDPRAVVGRVISTVGWVWGILFMSSRFFASIPPPIGDVLAFFGTSFWIPAGLVFVGRALKGKPVPDSEDEPVVIRPRPPVAPPVKAPTLPTEPPKAEPRPAAKYEPKPAAKSEPKPVFEDPNSMELPDMTVKPTYKPKSSEEMLAEAKQKLNRQT